LRLVYKIRIISTIPGGSSKIYQIILCINILRFLMPEFRKEILLNIFNQKAYQNTINPNPLKQ